MDDRATKRCLSRSLDVDVDPLVVTGDTREVVDVSCETACQLLTQLGSEMGFEPCESADHEVVAWISFRVRLTV